MHRDVKPSNVWLVGGDLGHVKILDFGIARGVETRAVTAAGTIIGTPAYMAPEQVRGDGAVDARADVYSLACILFECLVGRPPFAGDHAIAVLAKTLIEEAPRVREIDPSVPPELDALVARALSKDPSARPADAMGLVRAIDAIGEETAVASVPPSVASGAITVGERRVASVILFGGAQGEDATVSSDAWSGAVRAARAVVDSFGARLELMVGGSVVVLLEGRGAATDRAARAASCALALRDATGARAMALATGSAEVGRVPIGRAVDRAAAMLREGTPGIRVDDVTMGLLGEDFDTGRGVLVGRRESDHARMLLGRPMPMVGRDFELATLEATYDACVSESRARAVIVTGPAGIGKSRLRHELVRRVRAKNTSARMWNARGDVVGAASPFGLASQLVRRAAGVLEGEAASVRQGKLRACVSSHIADASAAARVTCFLAEVIGAPIDDPDDVVLVTARRDATVMFDQIRLAFADFVAAFCAEHPLVIVLEDLHWGDRPSLSLADFALQRVEQELLIVAFARPDLAEVFPDLWASRSPVVLNIGPLSKKSAERLVVAALGAKATRDVIDRIVERAAGNAFYLEELVRATADGRSETPETALLMVQSRLEALDGEVRRVLRAASVFGLAFWESGVGALVGDAHEAERGLAELLAREIVQPRAQGKFAGERELTFHHALVQEAAYAMLTDRDRATGHELAATWLERAGETDAVTLAEHWERAGQPSNALAMWKRAASQSMDGNDYVEAVARVERAVACGASGDTLGALRAMQAEAGKWRGDNAQTARWAAEAMASSPEGGDVWSLAAADFAMASQRLLRMPELLAVAELVRARLAQPNAELVRAAARIAHYLVIAGEREACDRLLAAAESSDAQHLDPTTRGRLEQVRASRSLRDGRPAEYVERLTEAARLAEESGDIRQVCSVRSSLGYGLLELGAVQDAERELRAVLADARRLGLRHVASYAEQNLGWTLFRRGNLDEAVALQRACALEFHAEHDQRMEGASRTYLALILLAQNDLAAAEAEARAGLELARDSPPSRPMALAALARVLLRADRKTEALEASRESMSELEKHGAEEGEALARLVRAETLAASGDDAGAASVIAHAHAQLVARADRIERPEWRRAFFDAIEEHALIVAHHERTV